MWQKAFLEGVDIVEYINQFFMPQAIHDYGTPHIKKIVTKSSLEDIYHRMLISKGSAGTLWGSLLNKHISRDYVIESDMNKISDVDWALCRGYVHPRDVLFIIVDTPVEINPALRETISVKKTVYKMVELPLKYVRGTTIPEYQGAIVSQSHYNDILAENGYSISTSRRSYSKKVKEEVESGPKIYPGKDIKLIRDLTVDEITFALQNISSMRYVEALNNELLRKTNKEVDKETEPNVKGAGNPTIDHNPVAEATFKYNLLSSTFGYKNGENKPVEDTPIPEGIFNIVDASEKFRRDKLSEKMAEMKSRTFITKAEAFKSGLYDSELTEAFTKSLYPEPDPSSVPKINLTPGTGVSDFVITDSTDYHDDDEDDMYDNFDDEI